ncbi:fatty acid--CoA ligase [Pseudalkalibacillus salsuginis]|uniref:fatty acid--CoA ligase n=1 Tax=Pseudalkalibacillus salsuginis TaxID=2910972 RepID=UPI001F40A5CF|nr:fatty acid--CoA ligase [Pseudalkalibacillus salsuginis]MCF6408957.1 fatty acid--CoA ligase [Pseudalkalibacillus salsuginis]
MYVTIGKLFELTVQKFPNKEALVDTTTNQRWTYKEWDENVNRLANALIGSGVRKGDRVSTFLFNTTELATAFFACAKIGAILNPINFRLKAQEVVYIIEDAKPAVFLFEEMLEPHVAAIYEHAADTSFWCISNNCPSYAVDYHDRVREYSTKAPEVEVGENDLYAIMYTSGTTGRPKGVMHRHRDMVEQSIVCAAVKQLTENDRGLVAAPMFHCAELHCCFLPRVHVGATNVIIHHFKPQQALQVINQEKISVFFGAPTMWNMILQQDLTSYDISSLRLGLYGAAPMAPALVRACKEKLGIDLIQAYGMTEMGPAITFLSNAEQISKAGSAGRACLNHEVRVVRPNEHGPSEPEEILPPGEVGEIIVRGPSMMVGYFNREEATEKAMYKGWYHSGDLGYMDEDRYLYVADRVDDMIITGGENVYPREVEDVLYEHEGVLDVAVLGTPDEKWGERVTAVIVKKDERLTDGELEQFCKSSTALADFKRPRNYIFVKELPRNASGKIQKYLLRKQYNRDAETQMP